MKFIFLSFLIMVSSFFNLKKDFSEFDNKLSNIAREFKNKIFDENECSNLKNEASYLAIEIEDLLEDSGAYSNAEIIELEKLKKEAKALSLFIGHVGGCGNYMQNSDEFNLANKRVNAEIRYALKSKSCIDIIIVEIGKYVCYIAKSNSEKNYRVKYNWKSNNGIHTGDGSMGLSKNNMRSIYNNREEVEMRNISIFGIDCKEF